MELCYSVFTAILEKIMAKDSISVTSTDIIAAKKEIMRSTIFATKKQEFIRGKKIYENQSK